MIDIGCGLYGLKDLSQIDFWDCFEKVSKCGFTFIEPFMLLTDEQEKDLMQNVPKIRGIGWSLSRWKEITPRLNQLGIPVESAHIITDKLEDDEIADSLIEISGQTGIRYFMTSPMIDDPKKAIEFSDKLSTINGRLRNHGVYLCYHNHAQEFNRFDGKYIMDLILENAGSDVKMQLDTGWAMYGGCNVLEFIERNNDRIISIHLKDFISDFASYPKNDAHTAVGSGVLPTKDILKTIPKLNLKEHGLLIDQDYPTLNGDIFEDYVKGIRFIEKNL